MLNITVPKQSYIEEKHGSFERIRSVFLDSLREVFARSLYPWFITSY